MVYKLGAGMVPKGDGLADQNRSFWPPGGFVFALVEFFFASCSPHPFQTDLSIDRTAAAE